MSAVFSGGKAYIYPWIFCDGCQRLESQLSLAGIQVFAFRTSHDAASSFGFRLWAKDDVLGYMTDTGVVTGAAHEALQGCRILAIEANHDPAMLKNGPYPRALQERVSSERGHLSNEQASEELRKLLHPGLEEQKRDQCVL